MDTSKRENVWSLSGKNTEKLIFDRKTLTKKEVVFVQFIARGMSLQQAYLNAYDTENPRYALEQSAKLMKTERVKTAMKEELKPVCEELGIDPKSVLEDIQYTSKNAEKEDVRLRALFKLSDILDLEDKTQTKITEVVGGVFKGFSQELLEEAKAPELTEGKNE